MEDESDTAVGSGVCRLTVEPMSGILDSGGGLDSRQSGRLSYDAAKQIGKAEWGLSLLQGSC